MGFFDGIQNASYYNRSKHIPEGTHILIGKKFSLQKSAKNPSVANFIAEFVVESTTSNEIAPGDTVSAVYLSSHSSFLRNVKYLLAQYLFACEKAHNPQITQAEVDAKISEGYIEGIVDGDGTTYANYRVKSIGRGTTIKNGPNAGQPFIAHEWAQPDSDESF